MLSRRRRVRLISHPAYRLLVCLSLIDGDVGDSERSRRVTQRFPSIDLIMVQR